MDKELTFNNLGPHHPQKKKKKKINIQKRKKLYYNISFTFKIVIEVNSNGVVCVEPYLC